MGNKSFGVDCIIGGSAAVLLLTCDDVSSLAITGAVIVSPGPLLTCLRLLRAGSDFQSLSVSEAGTTWSLVSSFHEPLGAPPCVWLALSEFSVCHLQELEHPLSWGTAPFSVSGITLRKFIQYQPFV